MLNLSDVSSPFGGKNGTRIPLPRRVLQPNGRKIITRVDMVHSAVTKLRRSWSGAAPISPTARNRRHRVVEY